MAFGSTMNVNMRRLHVFFDGYIYTHHVETDFCDWIIAKIKLAPWLHHQTVYTLLLQSMIELSSPKDVDARTAWSQCNLKYPRSILTPISMFLFHCLQKMIYWLFLCPVSNYLLDYHIKDQLAWFLYSKVPSQINENIFGLFMVTVVPAGHMVL